MFESGSDDIPQDFIDALAHFDKQGFFLMETVFNEMPPTAETLRAHLAAHVKA
jgi:hypothetical protein